MTLRALLRLSRWLLLCLLAGSTALLSWALLTEQGLNWSLSHAAGHLPGKLEFAIAKGRWLDTINLREVRYSDRSGVYTADQVLLSWNPARLLNKELDIVKLSIQRPLVRTAQQPASANRPPLQPGWRLPLHIKIQEADVHGLQVLPAGASEPRLVFDQLRVQADLEDTGITLNRVDLTAPHYTVSLHGQVSLQSTGASALEASWRFTPPALHALEGKLVLQGNWQQAELNVMATQPAAVNAHVLLQSPLQDFQWRLQIDAEPAHLRDIADNWPGIMLGLSLKAAGDRHSASMQGRIVTDAGSTTLESYDLQLQRLHMGAATDWQLDQLEIRQTRTSGRLALSGEARDSQDILATLSWSGLGWPLSGETAIRSGEGEIQFSGSPDNFRVNGEFELDGRQLPHGRWQIDANGNRERLVLSSLHGELLDGSVDASAEVQLGGMPQWTARVQGHRLNPGLHWPEFPGRINADLRSSGALRHHKLQLTTVIESVTGRIRGLPLQAHGNIAYSEAGLQVDDLRVTAGDARFSVDGQVADSASLQWSLRAKELSLLHPALGGELDANGRLQGDTKQARLIASLRGRRIKLQDRLRLDTLDGRIDAGMDESESTIRLSASGLTLSQHHLGTATFTLAGVPGKHRLTLSNARSPTEVLLSATGAWEDGTGTWRGLLRSLSIKSVATGAWRLERTATLQLASAELHMQPVCLLGGLTDPPGSVCLDLDRQQATWQGELNMRDIALAQLQPLLGAGIELDGRYNGKIQASGSLADRNRPVRHAVLDLRIGAGTLRRTDLTAPLKASFSGASLTSRLENGDLRGELQLKLAGEDSVRGHWLLPDLRFDQPGRQRLNVQASTRLQNLALLETLIPGIAALQGQFTGDFGVTGRLEQPRVAGNFSLRAGLQIPAAGLALDKISLNGHSVDYRRWRIEGQAESGTGHLSLEADLEPRSTAALEGRLSLSGNDFLAVNLPDARVIVSPDIHLRLANNLATINGQLDIPEASIRIPDRSSAVRESSDVVIVNPQEDKKPLRQAHPFQVSTELDIHLGEKVHFDGYGLSTDVQGNLRLAQKSEKPFTANGSLSLVNAAYTAYGQTLAVEKGRIFYSGGLLTRPGIDLRAIRKTGEVTAGIEVSGLVQQPSIRLFSQPALPQSEILSYLLLGRPTRQASSAEGQLLAQAASKMGLKGGNLIASRLGETFGLDKLTLEAGDTYQQTSVSVGKYLTPRLYIDYSLGLLDAVNRLRLNYQISKRWSVQTETGLETGGDLLYSRER